MRTNVWKVTIGLAACGVLVLPISSASANAPVPQTVARATVAQSSHSLASLRLGDRGPQIATWQARVNGLIETGVIAGPALVEDGYFGPRTRAASLAVQARLNLPQDAVVGPLTRAAMAEQEAHAGLPIGAGLRADQSGERVLAQGMRGEDVISWQKIVNDAIRLGQLELPRIAEDGDFGPQTLGATRALQTAANVRADGHVGPRSRAAVGWLLEGLPD